MRRFKHALLWLTLVGAWLSSGIALAHCDALDGPVAKDAAVALERRDVARVLRWVRASDEPAIRAAFDRTLRVRAQGEEARALADQFFLETLVRLHRAGEGEPFTGMKPAGGIAPGLAAADEALRRGTIGTLADDLASEIRDGIRGRHAFALRRAGHADQGIAEGREYVEAYVDYVHYIESVHRLVQHGASHRHPDAGTGEPPTHARKESR